jgi:hypothetical protein
LEPSERGGMMNVRVERQREPQVDVREKHRPLPAIPRRDRQSGAMNPDALSGLMEI